MPQVPPHPSEPHVLPLHCGVHTQTLALVPVPQLCEPAQVPQDETVRLTPQLSVAVTWPQLFPRRAQNAMLDSGTHAGGQVPHEPPHPSGPHVLPTQLGVHAQTLGAEPPPQLWGAAQAPHEATVRLAPQLSVPATWPQFFPWRAQNAGLDSGVQPQTFASEAPQVCEAGQVPQEVTVRLAPQLSVAVTGPQFFPWRAQNAGLDSGVHVGGQVPHEPPQPSSPQVLPAQLGAQPQEPAALHVCGATQEPQEATVRLTPQLSEDVAWPQLFPNRAQKSGSLSGTHAGGQTPQEPPQPSSPQVLPVQLGAQGRGWKGFFKPASTSPGDMAPDPRPLAQEPSGQAGSSGPQAAPANKERTTTRARMLLPCEGDTDAPWLWVRCWCIE